MRHYNISSTYKNWGIRYHWICPPKDYHQDLPQCNFNDKPPLLLDGFPPFLDADPTEFAYANGFHKFWSLLNTFEYIWSLFVTLKHQESQKMRIDLFTSSDPQEKSIVIIEFLKIYWVLTWFTNKFYNCHYTCGCSHPWMMYKSIYFRFCLTDFNRNLENS